MTEKEKKIEIDRRVGADFYEKGNEILQWVGPDYEPTNSLRDIPRDTLTETSAKLINVAEKSVQMRNCPGYESDIQDHCASVPIFEIELPFQFSLPQRKNWWRLFWNWLFRKPE